MYMYVAHYSLSPALTLESPSLSFALSLSLLCSLSLSLLLFLSLFCSLSLSHTITVEFYHSNHDLLVRTYTGDYEYLDMHVHVPLPVHVQTTLCL